MRAPGTCSSRRRIRSATGVHGVAQRMPELVEREHASPPRQLGVPLERISRAHVSDEQAARRDLAPQQARDDRLAVRLVVRVQHDARAGRARRRAVASRTRASAGVGVVPVIPTSPRQPARARRGDRRSAGGRARRPSGRRSSRRRSGCGTSRCS